MIAVTLPPLDTLAEWFVCDPEAGALFWRKSPRRGIAAGARAGYVEFDGYTVVCVRRRRMHVHRVIYAMATGNACSVVDHRNGIRSDNRLANLRAATASQNGANRSAQVNSKLGIKGVDFHKKSGRFRAQIRVEGAKIHLGLFRSPDDAARAYNAAALSYFGEFARLNPL